ncbi:hypothetical protein, conserved [Leishmania tarentolae]|uniref:Uncharacterized protein n=1 Tax=Leishmania tarentolae TaxID=5689 RepID=A0A640KG31_LEITA|nr:hypothetical protein, conserved [Leishmania tarentolae]
MPLSHDTLRHTARRMRRYLAFLGGGASCGASGVARFRRISSTLQTFVSSAGIAWSSSTQTFPRSSSATIVLARHASCGAVCTPARHFGNAPSRIRPVETPPENMWRQSERETSASIVIVIMFMVPMWLYVLTAHGQEEKRTAVRAWALEQRAKHHHSEVEAEGKA